MILLQFIKFAGNTSVHNLTVIILKVYVLSYTGMDNFAVGNVDAGERQQATLACTPTVNTHATHHCILPMSLSCSVPKSGIENWRETVIFLKLLFFFFFIFSWTFKDVLNGKNIHTLFSNEKKKKKKKKNDD